MATYVCGDIQGCADSLRALVSQLKINPRSDQLWCVGDLVNRGPRSAEVLRLVRDAGPHMVTVLGNHDLHLLAVACGARRPVASDTLGDVLTAPDAADLLHWLRHQPLAHAEGSTLMVHAGVLPDWTLTDTLQYAKEVSTRLASDHWQEFLYEMYGNSPAHWRDGLRGQARLRAIVNVLTRMRYLDRASGNLEFKCKLSPVLAPAHLVPWFEVRGRRTARQTVVFGHWSTLGVQLRPRLIALDSGCVWQGYLSAVRLEDRALFQQVGLEH
ncbi:MAG: symmetrical bis(5'-nucleosyl)-tetraphosphatase [Betaproteobacteria bacterium]|nr:symmetrical bis(5'-nucleosyl)-tetraphosphatase [Betaproteobacteria bacterium]